MDVQKRKKLCPLGHKLVYIARQKRMRCRDCDKIRGSKYYYANRDKISEKIKYVNLQLRYGLTRKVYEALFLSQENLCAICKKPGKRLVVDHCHKTNEVRGLLCDKCNFMIGLANDDKTILENAITYLK